MGNIVRARVKIRGTRALIQHHFGPESIALEKQEKTGVAGNVPDEWKKTKMVDSLGRLFLPSPYAFGCIRNGAVHTKSGRGTMKPAVEATLEIEDEVILVNRVQPPENELTQQELLSPSDPEIVTFIYVCAVKNPNTKSKNVRYRLATRAGWEASFTIRWDKTIVSKEQMKAILRDSGKYGGLGDGLKVGAGRFDVVSYEELDAEETTGSGTVAEDQGNGMAEGRPAMRKVSPKARLEPVSH